MKDLFRFPARLALLFLAICAGLAAFAVVAAAEPQILLTRHATTRPANVRAVETIQRLYLSDGTVREKSLGVVMLGRSDDFGAKH